MPDFTNNQNSINKKKVREVPFDFQDFSKELPVKKKGAGEPKKTPPAEFMADPQDGEDLELEQGPAGLEDLNLDLASGESPEDWEEDQDQWPAKHMERVIVDAERKAYELVEKAGTSAQEILELAREHSESLKAEAQERGYREGFDKGFEEGQKEGQMQGYKEMADKYTLFFEHMREALDSIDQQKEENLRHYLEDLKNVALAVAQKVIYVSLESSGEVIKRMILSAVESGRDKQWGKVFISAIDDQKMKEDGIDMQKMLWGFSDRIKIIILDDAEPGTCVVEFPDQMIDAGVKTQLRNIEELAESIEIGGEPPEGEDGFVL